MIVFTRKINERIKIGDNIYVVFLGFHGKQIKIGIEAPSDVDVDRQEVALRKEAERKRTEQ